MNGCDATVPLPPRRRDILKARSGRNETLTKVIPLSTFIYDFLTFRNLSQRLKVKNGDFKHFTSISASNNKGVACGSTSRTIWPNNFFGGFFSHGSYV